MVVVIVAAACGGGTKGAATNAGSGRLSGSGAGNGAGTGQGSGSQGSSGQINATLTGHHYFREVDDHADPAGEVIDTARIDWTVTISGSLAGYRNGTVLPKLSLSGEVTQQGSGSSSAISCAGTLSAKPNLVSGDLGTFLTIFPPGDTQQTLTGNFGVGPTTNIGSPYFLLEGNLPAANPQFIISGNTNPSQSGCNTGGLTLYYGQAKGSAQYSDWVQVLDPIANFSSDGKSPTGASHAFNWSGPIPAPPGYTSTVTEQDSETFTFAPVT
jgi:hypothetical protein